jgi:hypothetical protein
VAGRQGPEAEVPGQVTTGMAHSGCLYNVLDQTYQTGGLSEVLSATMLASGISRRTVMLRLEEIADEPAELGGLLHVGQMSALLQALQARCRDRLLIEFARLEGDDAVLAASD